MQLLVILSQHNFPIVTESVVFHVYKGIFFSQSHDFRFHRGKIAGLEKPPHDKDKSVKMRIVYTAVGT